MIQLANISVLVLFYFWLAGTNQTPNWKH